MILVSSRPLAEIVKAIAPIGDILGAKESVVDGDIEIKHRGSGWNRFQVSHIAMQLVWLIWQSCERRGWSIETLAAVPATWVHTNGESNHRADGTSVLSLCAAYAAARRASEEKKP